MKSFSFENDSGNPAIVSELLTFDLSPFRQIFCRVAKFHIYEIYKDFSLKIL